jgi:3',5'-cyclic-AMP phosphodiesterase
MFGMNAFNVIQISDTHLSREKPWFVQNFEAIVRIISARQPNLVVNTGDIALNGVDREDDLSFAQGCHAALDVPLRVVPGNHDVGDNPWQAEVEQPITEARLTRYHRHFGADYWLVDAGDWVLLGLNAQLLGSGLAAEDEQWSFLASAKARVGRRPVALFVHKPLFNERPTETDVNHAT